MSPACAAEEEQERRLLFRFPGHGEGVLRRMDRLREQRRFCDVTVRLGGLRVPGHRVVFAAGSPVLRERLLRSGAPELRLSLAQGAEVGRRLLLCCYTGRLEVPPAELGAYLAAASSLQMGHVAERCAQALSRRWGPEAGASLCGEDSEEEEEEPPSPYEGAAESSEAAWVDSTQRGPLPPALSMVEIARSRLPGCDEKKSTSGRLPLPRYLPHWRGKESKGEEEEEDEEEPPSPFGGEYSEVGSSRRGPSLSFLDSAAEITRSYLQGCYESKRLNHSPRRYRSSSNKEEQPFSPLEEEGAPGEGAEPSKAEWAELTQCGPSSSALSLAMGIARGYGDTAGTKRLLPSPHTPHRHGESTVHRDWKASGVGGSRKLPPQWPERPFRCPRCGRPFQQLGPLASHVRELHRLCLCLRCGKAFSQKSNLTRHGRVHTGVKPFQCPVCRKRFTQKATLQDHLNLHRGLKPHRCNYCAVRFAHKPGLRRHLKEMHGKSTVQNSRQEAGEAAMGFD